MNWSQVSERYLKEYRDTPPPVREVLEEVAHGGLAVISRALDSAAAEDSKPDSASFLLYVIGHALEDHTLTDAEVNGLTTLRRVFRIDEGDLFRLYPDVVTDLLCRQAELIFEDQAISRGEALHKVRLQEVFGLGYDEFMAVLEPEIKALSNSLYAALDAHGPAAFFGTEWGVAAARLEALSLVRYVEWLGRPSSTRAGYLYLLINSSMPDMVKIGRTGHPPRKRAVELASATGVPTPFTLVFDIFVSDQFAAEAYVHRVLTEKGARVSDNREFFAVDPSEAVRVMLEASRGLGMPGRQLGPEPPESQRPF